MGRVVAPSSCIPSGEFQDSTPVHADTPRLAPRIEAVVRTRSLFQEVGLQPFEPRQPRSLLDKAAQSSVPGEGA